MWFLFPGDQLSRIRKTPLIYTEDWVDLESLETSLFPHPCRATQLIHCQSGKSWPTVEVWTSFNSGTVIFKLHLGKNSRHIASHSIFREENKQMIKGFFELCCVILCLAEIYLQLFISISICKSPTLSHKSLLMTDICRALKGCPHYWLSPSLVANLKPNTLLSLWSPTLPPVFLVPAKQGCQTSAKCQPVQENFPWAVWTAGCAKAQPVIAMGQKFPLKTLLVLPLSAQCQAERVNMGSASDLC